jgi:hypothetical protein
VPVRRAPAAGGVVELEPDDGLARRVEQLVIVEDLDGLARAAGVFAAIKS